MDTNNENKAQTLKCTECGSTDLRIIENEFAICNYCGARMILPKQTVVQHNEIKIIQNVTSSDVPELPMYYILPEFDEKRAMQEYLNGLLRNPGVLPAVFDCEFSPMRSVDVQFFKLEFDVNLTYSATLGYDYVVTTKSIDGNGREHVEKHTETEWKPFSGSKAKRITLYLKSDCETVYSALQESKTLATVFSSINQTSIVPVSEKTAEIDLPVPIPPIDEKKKLGEDAAIETLKNEAIASLPVSKYRNFDASGIAKIVSTKCYTIRSYETKYEYQNAQYTGRVYSCGESTWEEMGEMPNEADKINEQIVKAVRPFFLLSFFCSLASLVLSIFVRRVLLIVLPFVVAIGTFVLQVVFKKKNKENILDSILKDKYQRYKKKIEKREIDEGEETKHEI